MSEEPQPLTSDQLINSILHTELNNLLAKSKTNDLCISDLEKLELLIKIHNEYVGSSGNLEDIEDEEVIKLLKG